MFSAEKSSGGDFSGWITFNDVFINEGNGMDGNSGIFTSPENGYYLFGFKAATSLNSKDWTRVKVYLNDEFKFQISDGNSADIWNNIAATWVWGLAKGSTVRLKVDHHKLDASGEMVIFWGLRISDNPA